MIAKDSLKLEDGGNSVQRSWSESELEVIGYIERDDRVGAPLQNTHDVVDLVRMTRRQPAVPIARQEHDISTIVLWKPEWIGRVRESQYKPTQSHELQVRAGQRRRRGPVVAEVRQQSAPNRPAIHRGACSTPSQPAPGQDMRGPQRLAAARR